MTDTPHAVDSQLASDPARELVSRLGPWATGHAPAYRELADAIAAAVGSGALRGRLPSERELAAATHVSRSTAVATYGLLTERGIVDRRRGSGTFVVPGARASHVCDDPVGCVRAFFGEG